MLTLLISALGFITVFLSAYVWISFHKLAKEMPRESRRFRLTRALSWQLLGEAILGLGTLTFAISAHFGALASWPELVQSTIRFIMFLATSLTSIHLFKTVTRMQS